MEHLLATKNLLEEFCTRENSCGGNLSAVVSTLEAAQATPVSKEIYVLLQQLDENQKAEKAKRLKEMTSGATNIYR